uniref:Zgc:172182 n=1 Tax=Seriola lalandi dorsalis TaxID=1841481 RepID=A0A3B4WIG2_SERLL
PQQERAPHYPCRKIRHPTIDMDIIQKSLDKLLSFSAEDMTETEMLRSRIDEQSNLICILKERADELLLRCQALQKINTELEDTLTDCQKELGGERKKAELLEKRFMDLAANNQAIIAFMEEYKSLNVQLKVENKQLQSENDTLFSQKLQDKEVFVQKLMQDSKLEKLAEYQSKLLQQATQHQAKEAFIVAFFPQSGMKLKLGMAEEKQALKEINTRESITSLAKEKDKLLSLSMERGRVIQVIDKKAVNADVKVKSLQCALDESTGKYEKLKKDFDAFREHSASLLTQERELNKKLRHMIG